ncbi:MAG: lactate utilization protein [Bacteroidales bacterium]|jgi:L-lactate dehydrogenase complex protein LldG|nr:lactate utilization protein [Bacteroidales bacterium]NLM91627.1 LUD domain-containing protein [Bacteroidales bacterium]
MKESTTKEKILKKVRDALVNQMLPPYESVDLESPVHAAPDSEFLDVSFAEAFSKVNGKFVYCADYEEFGDNLRALLEDKGIDKLFCGEEFFRGFLGEKGIACIRDCKMMEECQASLTSCEVLVSRLGTIVMSSIQGGGRRSFIYPPVHIVVASTRQLVWDIKDAFQFLNKKYDGVLPSMITFVTGPSRTADIEKTLVHGAHGPKEVYLFLVDNR